MIKHISAQSASTALAEGLYHLNHFGIAEDSRNGPVIVSRMPVVTTYLHPERRVLVSERRDANPFFHLFESLWMLAGRNDVAFPAKFASNLASYSDDAVTLHGAYGYRWRSFFGYDQLNELITLLKKDPKTRRAVLQMWDGGSETDYTEFGTCGDLQKAHGGGLDVPCNTAAYFDTIGGKLNMTVTCRSNDIIWGAFGANAVHFSILLEYMAAMTGIPMGVYRQFSNNFHAYESVVRQAEMPSYADSVSAHCVYSSPGVLKVRDFSRELVRHVPLVKHGEELTWHDDLDSFMESVDSGEPSWEAWGTDFFKQAVGPMYAVWSFWKAKEFEAARHASLTIAADDWRLAAQSWLSIREQRREEKASV